MEKKFPIVGIGASAGGFEAFSKLLGHLSTDTGMAFILIQHLDPTHESILTKLLEKVSRMPISEVKNNTRVQPNHVYVIPSNAQMEIKNSVLTLSPRRKVDGQYMIID